MTRPKREFQVGDRVSVNGWLPTGIFCNKEPGQIHRPLRLSNKIEVKMDDGGAVYQVHPKQLRRLKPRKRRSWEGRWMKAGELMTGSVVFAPSSSVIDLAPLLDESRTTLIEAPSGRRR